MRPPEPAAHIAVIAREPRLLERAAPPVGPPPDAGGERPPPFVDRERLACVLDRSMEAHLVVPVVLLAVDQLPEQARRSQRPHGVPDADEADGRTGPGATDVLEDLRPHRRADSLAPLVAGEDVRNVEIIVLLD